MKKSYPINTNPIYCYRSPYYLFTSWISSNRVKRSLSFSRMFKYDATYHFKRENLLSQFENAKNDNEVDFIKELGTYKYKEFNFDKTKIDSVEEKRLVRLVKENINNAKYWSKINMLYRFENIVSNPDLFTKYLMERFDIEFNKDSLKKGILLMDKRPIEEVIELDLNKIKIVLQNLGCKKKTIDFILKEQKIYIENL